MCYRPAMLRDSLRFPPLLVATAPSLVASAAAVGASACFHCLVSFRFLAATHFHIWTIAATSCAATANSHSRPLRSIHVPQQCQPALVPLAVCSRRRRHCQRRAVHSITIICLYRESSLSLSLSVGSRSCVQSSLCGSSAACKLAATD